MTTAKKPTTRAATKGKRTTKATESTAADPKAAPRARAAAAPKPTTTPASNASEAPTPTTEALRKKDLIDAVVERSEVKKKDAKPVVEALLSILGDAVAEGREMNLQPFGKLKVNRTKDLPNGKLSIVRIRQSSATESDAGE